MMVFRRKSISANMTMHNKAGKYSTDHSRSSKLYEQPGTPFSIGLKPLEAKDFLQIDEDFLPYRRAKQQLYAALHDRVCVAEEDTLNAQLDVEKLITDNLRKYHGQLYRIDQKQAVCQQTGEIFSQNEKMPIASIGLLVPEDLVLMRRDQTGWRLVASSLSFPASWSLKEKFSRNLEAVHGPVPLSPKMAQRINRIFDTLKPDIPVWRANWAFDNDRELRQERFEYQRRTSGERLVGDVQFRNEFQTLHKLPISGDVLFTIRTKTRPLESLVSDRNGRQKLALLHKQYLDMSEAERDYKGVNHNAEGLLAWLEENGSR